MVKTPERTGVREDSSGIFDCAWRVRGRSAEVFSCQTIVLDSTGETSFPLNRRGRLAANVVHNAIESTHFVDDAVRDFRE
jgi:hypothetical protein